MAKFSLGNNVVVSAGVYSKQFNQTQTCEKREIEYYVFDNIEGMPGGILEFDKNDNEYYGMLDGKNLDQFKIGEFAARNLNSMVKYLKDRLPDKFETILYVHPCLITMTGTGDFQYKTDKNGVHYAYGFEGTGFKFMPLHGKIVYDGLITKKDQTYIPKMFKAKL